MTFALTQAGNDAMLSGGFLAGLNDSGTNGAYAILYQSATALVTMVFARPCAVFTAHQLVFVQGDPTGDQIMTQGDADNFELYSGAGVKFGAGDVGAVGSSAALIVSGTAVGTTRLYAGARALLASLVMG